MSGTIVVRIGHMAVYGSVIPKGFSLYGSVIFNKLYFSAKSSDPDKNVMVIFVFISGYQYLDISACRQDRLQSFWNAAIAAKNSNHSTHAFNICACNSHDPLYVYIRILNERDGSFCYLPRKWKYVPAEINADGECLIGTSNAQIIKMRDDNFSSPQPKKARNVDSLTHVEFYDDSDGKPTYYEDMNNDIGDCGEHGESILFDEMKTLLEYVLVELQQAGHLQPFHKFFQLVSQGDFPMNNICLLLFLDLVEFYACENTSYMKYRSESTVLFWKVGYLLIKGKFLRYCGGYKNKGQVKQGITEKGFFDPKQSSPNFVIPSLSVLDKCKIGIDEKFVKPGPRDEVINVLASSTDNSIKTYSLSVDGKNINSCSNTIAGAIDCFGHEPSPTKCDIEERHEREINHMTNINNFAEKLLVQLKVDMININEGDKPGVLNDLRETHKIISGRLKELNLCVLKNKICIRKGAAKGCRVGLEKVEVWISN